MKKCYFLLSFFLTAWFATQAACPVSISAGGPLFFCTGDSVQLTATPGAGYTFHWRSNGSNIAGATNPIYYAKTTGNYAVFVTVISPSCTALSNTILLTAESPLIASVTPGTINMCGASTDMLEGSPIGGNYLYQWYEDT